VPHFKLVPFLLASGAAALLAQAPSSTPNPPVKGVLGGSGGGGVAGDAVFAFAGGKFSFDTSIVKGVPYTADAVTERIQTLADGNRITSKQTASVARDSEGRTRREEVFGAIGPVTSGGEPPRIVFINDPVDQVNYVLEPDHTARKLFVPTPDNVAYHASGSSAMPSITIDATTAAPLPPGAPPPPPPPGAAATRWYVNSTSKVGNPGKTESLGTQMIEGVQAEGSRTTTTIPAGRIGNEQPIEIVFERWYSPDIQAVVMTRHSDPRVGENIYRLTNIQRVEPPASLFQVPADYKLVDGGDTVRSVRFDKN
jgi:hypothetical protein